LFTTKAPAAPVSSTRSGATRAGRAAAPPVSRVELEIAGRVEQGAQARRDGRRQGRPAEIRMQEDAGRVEHPAQAALRLVSEAAGHRLGQLPGRQDGGFSGQKSRAGFFQPSPEMDGYALASV
jgi:hypothetical protein